MVVQIPSRFDPTHPYIIVGPSLGPRGVYGAIATAGEWGLKKGCAVALTDAGKGMGLYDPGDDSVNRIDGTRASRSAAGALAHFAANLSDAARQAFNAAFPYRLALKHVHSQLNPEKDWGQDTLVAVRYALYALNQEYGQQVPSGEHEARFTPANTLVIAGSVSNGGAAVLRAAEQDTEALIDGVVANEPSAQPQATPGFGVQFGGNAVPTVGKPLIDYITIANLYQPCAALAPAASMSEASFYNYMVLTAMSTRAVEPLRRTRRARPCRRQQRRRAGGRCACEATRLRLERRARHDAQRALRLGQRAGRRHDVHQRVRPVLDG